MILSIIELLIQTKRKYGSFQKEGLSTAAQNPMLKTTLVSSYVSLHGLVCIQHTMNMKNS
jgi:hypothetical protein